MRFVSADRTMILSITEPAMGFTLSLAGHVWLFDSRLEITRSLAPPPGHKTARTPDACPGCTDFSIRSYGGKEGTWKSNNVFLRFCSGCGRHWGLTKSRGRRSFAK
jgi:hypothetical protein